jgi:hypothetical protein
VIALPKWEPVGSVWIALWPSDDVLLRYSDFYVSRLKAQCQRLRQTKHSDSLRR